MLCGYKNLYFAVFALVFTGNLSSSVVLIELSHRLTTAPDYLLKSSLLTGKDEQFSDKSNAALRWQEPSECKGLRTAAQVHKSSAQDGRSVETENHLLKSQLAYSLTENRLLAQLSAPCLKSSATTQLCHIGMKQLSQSVTADISQKVSQLSVIPSATKEKFNGTCAPPVSSSVSVGIKTTVLEIKSGMKEHVTKRKALDANGKSVTGTRKPKPLKKVKLAVPEQTDYEEAVSSFELPDYQLAHEHVESKKVELFVPPEKEQLVEELLRPIVDVQSIKVAVCLLRTNLLMPRPRIN